MRRRRITEYAQLLQSESYSEVMAQLLQGFALFSLGNETGVQTHRSRGSRPANVLRPLQDENVGDTRGCLSVKTHPQLIQGEMATTAGL